MGLLGCIRKLWELRVHQVLFPIGGAAGPEAPSVWCSTIAAWERDDAVSGTSHLSTPLMQSPFWV